MSTYWVLVFCFSLTYLKRCSKVSYCILYHLLIRNTKKYQENIGVLSWGRYSEKIKPEKSQDSMF